MRDKIIIILLSLFLVTIVGCQASDTETPESTDNEQVQIDDFDPEDITTTDIQNYSLTLMITSNGEQTYYTIIKCDTGWAYLVGAQDVETGYMYVIDGAKYYLVDTSSQTINLISEGDDSIADSSTVDDIFDSFLIGFEDYTQYFVSDGTATVSGRECVVYEFTFSSNGTDMTAKYYIDKAVGIALKYEIETSTTETSDMASWEVTEFHIDNQDLTPYIDWEVTSMY